MKPTEAWAKKLEEQRTIDEKVQEVKNTLDDNAKKGQDSRAFQYIYGLPESFQYRRHEFILYYYDKKIMYKNSHR